VCGPLESNILSVMQLTKRPSKDAFPGAAPMRGYRPSLRQAHEWDKSDRMAMRTMAHRWASSKPAVAPSLMRVTGLTLTLTASVQPAATGFTIMGATIAEGDLWIVGQVDEPNTAITLDGSFTENTDRRGRFEFRIAYHPATCTVVLKTERQSRAVVIANCGQRGPAGPPGPPGAAEPTITAAAAPSPAPAAQDRASEGNAEPGIGAAHRRRSTKPTMGPACGSRERAGWAKPIRFGLCRAKPQSLCCRRALRGGLSRRTARALRIWSGAALCRSLRASAER
jgi:hypothetical protein